MAGVIKSLKVTRDWTGDIYALKGFNVAITPEDKKAIKEKISHIGGNQVE